MADQVYPAGRFELTLDGDAEVNDPLEMMRHDYGCNQLEKWRHIGNKVVGKQTRRFVIVPVGYCANFSILQEKLAKEGTIPEGQWRQALKATYKPDGRGAVGIADPSWVDSYGTVRFPYVDGGVDSSYLRLPGRGYHWTKWWLIEFSRGYNGIMWWLVEVK